MTSSYVCEDEDNEVQVHAALDEGGVVIQFFTSEFKDVEGHKYRVEFNQITGIDSWLCDIMYRPWFADNFRTLDGWNSLMGFDSPELECAGYMLCAVKAFLLGVNHGLIIA